MDCEECGNPIPPKRIALLPRTRHCVRCAPTVPRRCEADFTGTNALLQHTENSNWRKPIE
jgi:RNA polymerase-binding transcription factor DksA